MCLLHCLAYTHHRTPVSVPRVYDALSKEVRTARAQLLVPIGTDLNRSPATTMGDRPPATCVLHLAGTGDHGFQRRLELGFPLLKQVGGWSQQAVRDPVQRYCKVL